MHFTDPDLAQRCWKFAHGLPPDAERRATSVTLARSGGDPKNRKGREGDSTSHSDRQGLHTRIENADRTGSVDESPFSHCALQTYSP